MENLRNSLSRSWPWLVIGLAALAIFGIVSFLVGVRPPQEITIATGRQGGAYYRFAEQYQQRFAEEGFTLNIRETAGAIETIQLLESGEVDAGFVQNTAIGSTLDSPLTTLAALYYEALWIFYRDELAIEPGRISDLVGLRINIGEPGSAGNLAISGLLAMNGISEETTSISTLPDGEAAEQLKAGDLDVVLTFLGATSPLVSDLLTTPGIALAPIRRAAAYAARYKNLAKVTLPEGVIDFDADVPPADTPMLASRATLVAGPTLQPGRHF